jgi:hypothetical protein
VQLGQETDQILQAAAHLLALPAPHGLRAGATMGAGLARSPRTTIREELNMDLLIIAHALLALGYALMVVNDLT